MPRPKLRLFTDCTLGRGARVIIDRDQSHYLKNVMRARQNTPVALFNGRDGEWLGTLVSVGKQRGEIEVLQQMRRQRPEPEVRLIFAPIKKARLDFLIEKAVELGVSRLSPVITHHTDVSRVNLTRLQGQAREAAEQCERLSVPSIDAPVALKTLLSRWAEDTPLLAAVERRPATAIANVLGAFGARQRCAFLIGPEGGFSVDEISLLDGLAFVRAITLGPHVLRAETAALAALACRRVLCDARTPVDDKTPDALNSSFSKA